MLTKESFTSLAQKYMDMIFRFAYNCLKSRADADDVTQNVLLSLYKTDKEFENDQHLKNWLLRVTSNECKKHWRSPWRKTADLDSLPKDAVWEEPQYGDLFHAIMELDRKYRLVILLYYIEGYSIGEIGQLLGLPKGTVGARLRRAREKLKHCLTEEE